MSGITKILNNSSITQNSITFKTRGIEKGSYIDEEVIIAVQGDIKDSQLIWQYEDEEGNWQDSSDLVLGTNSTKTIPINEFFNSRIRHVIGSEAVNITIRVYGNAIDFGS